jgi:hypothetical protein
MVFSMMKRLLVFGLGTTLIQVILFYFLIFIVYLFAALIAYSPSNDPNGDYVVLFSAMLLPIMILIQNFIASVINNIKATYVLIGTAIVIYVIGLIDIGAVSFKTGLCLAWGIVVLGVKTKIDDRLR